MYLVKQTLSFYHYHYLGIQSNLCEVTNRWRISFTIFRNFLTIMTP
jgi:hypothetical protein